MITTRLPWRASIAPRWPGIEGGWGGQEAPASVWLAPGSILQAPATSGWAPPEAEGLQVWHSAAAAAESNAAAPPSPVIVVLPVPALQGAGMKACSALTLEPQCCMQGLGPSTRAGAAGAAGGTPGHSPPLCMNMAMSIGSSPWHRPSTAAVLRRVVIAAWGHSGGHGGAEWVCSGRQATQLLQSRAGAGPRTAVAPAAEGSQQPARCDEEDNASY